MDSEFVLACLYCGDMMNKPEDTVAESLSIDGVSCCGFNMAEIHTDELYNVIRALDVIKEKCEEKLVEGF